MSVILIISSFPAKFLPRKNLGWYTYYFYYLGSSRKVDEVCAEMKKIILVGKKTEGDHFLLQDAEMLYKRTLTVFEKYSIVEEAITIWQVEDLPTGSHDCLS